MAIDYKKEWEKLGNAYGDFGVVIPHEALTVKLCSLMDGQIKDTIYKREALMQEYMRENMLTEIDGADKDYHHIKIVSARKKRGPIGTMYIHKKDFAKWCEKKGGK